MVRREREVSRRKTVYFPPVGFADHRHARAAELNRSNPVPVVVAGIGYRLRE